jgi:enolase
MAKILDIRGRQVWDSRGRRTVEAEVVVGRGTTPLATGRAIAPAGASTGSAEAKTVDVPTAVHNIGTRIRDGLRALSVSDQARIDERLIDLDGTPDKSRLGANAIVAVSLACAHADAAAEKVPLWRKLAGDRRVSLPVPQIQIFGGGAHARGRCDVQDYMIVCIGAGSFAEALEWTAQVYAAAGKRLAKRGALQGVADEGGYWPSFRSNEEGVIELVGAISDAGFEPGTPPRSSTAAGTTTSRWKTAFCLRSNCMRCGCAGSRTTRLSRSRTRSKKPIARQCGRSRRPVRSRSWATISSSPAPTRSGARPARVTPCF